MIWKVILNFLYEENEEDIQDIEINNEVEARFAKNYLIKFSAFSQIADELYLCLSPDVPLLFQYSTSIGNIKLFVSPKIED